MPLAEVIPVARRPADGRAGLPADLLGAEQPVVLEGFVAHWPLVRAGMASADAALELLASHYRDATVNAVYTEPEAKGRIFYNEDFTGFNFEARRVPLDRVMTELAEQLSEAEPPGIYVGSTTIDACLPGFRAENDVDLGRPDALASIWICNRSRVAAHFDLPDNLACNAVGHRRFTLFPPEQVANLYPGPLDFNPAGQAISLVDFAEPDEARFPRFREAMAHALVAELGPGDALYIPGLWWHHVEGLDALNVLVNYWWRTVPAWMDSPLAVVDYALLAIRGLPARDRRAWKSLFEHFVFDEGEEAAAQVPRAQRGALGGLDEASARQLRARLRNRLNR
ncbi:MAG: cupin-like domain-containing protein [Pseudomonadota bacterium]